jgi:hypothetical protein
MSNKLQRNIAECSGQLVKLVVHVSRIHDCSFCFH